MSAMPLAIRVQCEAVDCGALLEVPIPHEVQEVAPPFLIIRCANCSRLLQVSLPGSAYTPETPGRQDQLQPDMETFLPRLPTLPQQLQEQQQQLAAAPAMQQLPGELPAPPAAQQPQHSPMQQHAPDEAAMPPGLQGVRQALQQVAPPPELPIAPLSSLTPAPLSELMRQRSNAQQLQAVVQRQASSVGDASAAGPDRGAAAGAMATGARRNRLEAGGDEEASEDYQLFVSSEFHRLKQERPDLDNREALQLALEAWRSEQLKKRQRILPPTSPSSAATEPEEDGDGVEVMVRFARDGDSVAAALAAAEHPGGLAAQHHAEGPELAQASSAEQGAALSRGSG